MTLRTSSNNWKNNSKRHRSVHHCYFVDLIFVLRYNNVKIVINFIFFQAAKDELEASRRELEEMMQRLEESKSMEAEERAR